MSEIVGRVAMAMRSHENDGPYETVDAYWAGMARAAIEAMREPTVQMVAIGCEELPPLETDGFDNAGMIPRDVWQAMIDAALKVQP